LHGGGAAAWTAAGSVPDRSPENEGDSLIYELSQVGMEDGSADLSLYRILRMFVTAKAALVCGLFWR
jgi:hypothetical protein